LLIFDNIKLKVKSPVKVHRNYTKSDALINNSESSYVFGFC